MGGLSGNKSKNNSTNSFDQSIYGGWDGAYKGLMDVLAGGSGQAAGQIQNLMGDVIGGVQGNINQANPAQQNQLAGGAGYNQDLMNQYKSGLDYNSAEGEINDMVMGGRGNNYVDAMKNQMQQDTNFANANALNVSDARGVASGQSGSSRHGVSQANMTRDINRNLQRDTRDLGYNTFDKDLNRKLGIAQRADSNQAANMRGLEGMMDNQMNQNNAATQYGLGNVGNNMQNLLSVFQAPMAGMAPYGEAKNIMGGPIKLSSGSGSGSGSSKGGGVGKG